ncbi:MAG: type II toxin-antitoxin system VapC family toxin [Chthoniobacterales bacterium]|jgi:predicted nucleic acid-binding protein|nr:type II toxin-antitoxin system VapC family toxin [Chthoniobacterales bacterium]
MSEAYYDTAFLFKLQSGERGAEQVRAHAVTVEGVACSIHGRAEFASICHRKFREGAASRAQVRSLLAQLQADTVAGGIRWLPINPTSIERVEEVCRTAPATVFLRAGDALHLACAAENGFEEIYSNDRHLLAAAPLFELQGVNLIISA